MTRRGFDRFMVDNDIGRSLKLVGLTDSEWRAHVGGVLAIAAKSSIRGRLLIGDERARAEHIAAQAGVKVAAARSCMAKLRAIGVLVEDDEFDCERVHDWDQWNPAPKQDKTAAERQQRRRDKLKNRGASRPGHAPVTLASRRDARNVTPTEVEVEGEVENAEGSNPLEGSPLGAVGMSDAGGAAA
jgi:hypothetical protein